MSTGIPKLPCGFRTYVVWYLQVSDTPQTLPLALNCRNFSQLNDGNISCAYEPRHRSESWGTTFFLLCTETAPFMQDVFLSSSTEKCLGLLLLIHLSSKQANLYSFYEGGESWRVTPRKPFKRALPLAIPEPNWLSFCNLEVAEDYFSSLINICLISFLLFWISFKFSFSEMLHCFIFPTQFHPHFKDFLSMYSNYILLFQVLAYWCLVSRLEQLQVVGRRQGHWC